MRTLWGTAALLLCLSACTTTSSVREHPAVLRYQHVANVHEIRFTNPVQLPSRLEPVDFVRPRDSSGFWAVFVLCEADTSDIVLPGFRFNVDDVRIQYGKYRFGPLQPYTLRYQGSLDLNTPKDTPLIVQAIGAEIHQGPRSTVFERGHFTDLHFRFAIFVPRALPNYAGEPLQLRYLGQPAILHDNGYPPSDIRVAGGSGGGIAARCLP
ncbi:hypothetical protein [Massilia horti]|uniref:Lipoprotein n=1 Tax=Massilia horti TaxID=2562153 RepID=A0A4Y9SM91_9BURK|nr:hypothetical protein [Massilia horti]TFW27770.1 hypothetical protein E4O92_23200 [Massilia horti]